MKRLLSKAKSTLQELKDSTKSKQKQTPLQDHRTPHPMVNPPTPTDVIRYRYHHGANLGTNIPTPLVETCSNGRTNQVPYSFSKDGFTGPCSPQNHPAAPNSTLSPHTSKSMASTPLVRSGRITGRTLSRMGSSSGWLERLSVQVSDCQLGTSRWAEIIVTGRHLRG